MNHNLTKGYAESGNGDYVDPGTTKEFLKYNGYFVNQRILGEKDIFNFRSYIQLAKGKLLSSSEQILIGGMSTVRGYPEGELTGDLGYYFNIEIVSSISEKTDCFLFLDHGGAYPFKGNDEGINKDNYLTSTGIGLNIKFTERFSGNIVCGLPINLKYEPAIHLFFQWGW